MYFSKQFYKKGLALPAKHGFNFPPDLSFQFTDSSMEFLLSVNVLKRRTFVYVLKMLIVRHLGTLNSSFASLDALSRFIHISGVRSVVLVDRSVKLERKCVNLSVSKDDFRGFFHEQYFPKAM